MNELDIEIKKVDKWPEDEIVELYKSGGWWKDHYESSGIIKLIQGSYAFFIAIDNKTKKAIGMGRIISDGVSDAYFQDIVILKKYRGLGIGKKIAKALLDYCLSKNLYWIGLIAEPDQEGFYETLRFKKMKNYTPMKYESEE